MSSKLIRIQASQFMFGASLAVAPCAATYAYVVSSYDEMRYHLAATRGGGRVAARPADVGGVQSAENLSDAIVGGWNLGLLKIHSSMFQGQMKLE